MRASSFFLWVLLPLMGLLYLLQGRKEAFGTSPGTLVQLAADHVPTEAELRSAQGYPNTSVLIVIILILVLLLGVMLISK